MSYHNGSVWPHDNALIGMGLARYGYAAEAMQLLTSMFDTASAVPMFRLPELFCGFPARDDESPTHYPVACSPQAWASARCSGCWRRSPACGSGEITAAGRVQVRFRNPMLPRD